MKFLILIPLVTASFSCATQPPVITNPTLPAVEVRLDSNRYFLPECKKAMEIPARVLLVLPSAQEAELSGYMPAATCLDADVSKRLTLERELFGPMQPTEATEKRRSETLFRDTLDRTNH